MLLHQTHNGRKRFNLLRKRGDPGVTQWYRLNHAGQHFCLFDRKQFSMQERFPEDTITVPSISFDLLLQIGADTLGGEAEHPTREEFQLQPDHRITLPMTTSVLLSNTEVVASGKTSSSRSRCS